MQRMVRAQKSKIRCKEIARILPFQIRLNNYSFGMLYIKDCIFRDFPASSASMILPNAQPIIFLEYKSSTKSLVEPASFFGMNVRDACAPFLFD